MQDDLKNCPKISIITVSYNSAKTIEQTILSVINQSYKNIEYIIIDGGSTDGTVDIIKKYADKIAYWVSEPDEGISDAFNKGIKKSTGEIVGIINADDWYELDAVEKVANIITANEFEFIFGNLDYYDMNDKYCFTQYADYDYLENIKKEMSVAHPTVFVKKTVYDVYGVFDKRFKTAMDFELISRFCKEGVSGIPINEKIANMRLGGESYVNYIRALKEVRDISIMYGSNKFLANFLMFVRIIRVKTRKIFEEIGLASIVKVYRRKFVRADKFKWK